MPCYHPLKLVQQRQGPTHILLGSLDYMRHSRVVPCGKCIGCRLEYTRQWAMRIMHESKGFESNLFVTLTYADDKLTWGYDRPVLVPRDLELFWKRLRKEFGDGIRYFACGEYGESTFRPHYHACIFGLDFPDKVPVGSSNGFIAYHSDALDAIWKLGYCTIGSLTFESAAYVARYVMKKQMGNDVDGIPYNLEPEFSRMSRGSKKLGTRGIGYEFYSEFKRDIYPHDFVVIRNGMKCKPPRYYDKIYAVENPVEFSTLKNKRYDAAERNKGENEGERLAVREKVKYSKIKKLVRNI